MRRQLVRFKLAATLGVVGTTVAASPASGFDRKDQGQCAGMAMDENLKWRFVNGDENWTASEKAFFRVAIAKWSHLLGTGGNSVLDPDEDSSGIEVIRMSADGTNSNVTCNSNNVPTIWIHSPQATTGNPGSLPDSSSHEAGHAHGLEHVGKAESRMYNESVGGHGARMVGCNSVSNSGFPESDDWAQVMAKRNAPSLPVGRYNPDLGFESQATGSAHLEVWAGAKAIISDAGNHYASIGNVGSNLSNLRQIVRITNPPSIFTIKAKYKTASASGAVNFKFQYRSVNYPNSYPSCGNAWASKLDVDNPAWTSNWITSVNQTVSGSTTWKTTSRWTANPGPGSPFGEAVQAKMLAANADASVGDVYIDNFEGKMG